MKALALLLLLCACSKPDKCRRFVDKSAPVLRKLGGDKVSTAKLDDMVEMCRSRPATKDEELIDCVLGASDEPAVEACWQTGLRSYAGDAAKRQGGDAQ
ncbi:MAG TPA: hypothetical protein VIV40_32005 [Kofleriaceae bacterium]